MVRNESEAKTADVTAEADDSKYWQGKLIGSEHYDRVKIVRAGTVSG